jgi:hypothetical protein
MTTKPDLNNCTSITKQMTWDSNIVVYIPISSVVRQNRPGSNPGRGIPRV